MKRRATPYARGRSTQITVSAWQSVRLTAQGCDAFRIIGVERNAIVVVFDWSLVPRQMHHFDEGTKALVPSGSSTSRKISGAYVVVDSTQSHLVWCGVAERGLL